MSRATVRVALLGVALATAAAAAPPLVRRDAGGIELVPGDVWAIDSVAEILENGLTTQAEWQLQLRDGSGRRFELSLVARVRWDLWEERFRVEWAAATERHEASLGGRAELGRFWQAVRVRQAVPLAAAETWRGDLRLRVVPYSEPEGERARQWFTGGPESADPRQPPSAGSLLELVLSGSILAPEIFRDRWRVELIAPGDSGGPSRSPR